MQDEYAYLRAQCEEILDHCDYLLRHCVDPKVLAKAEESKQKAAEQLERLNRQSACEPGVGSTEL